MSSSAFGGQGSAGNVLAALANIFIPGVGQLAQGRVLPALGFFFGTLLGLCCCVVPGLVAYVWSILDAACWKPPAGN